MVAVVAVVPCSDMLRLVAVPIVCGCSCGCGCLRKEWSGEKGRDTVTHKARKREIERERKKRGECDEIV